MKIQRVDEWTSKEDKLLAEKLLDYVRHGKTQLQAFEDVGEMLDRSAPACGFRWNSTLRKEYAEQLRVAKRVRRGQKLDMPKYKQERASERGDIYEKVKEIYLQKQSDLPVNISKYLRLVADIIDQVEEELKKA